MARLRAAICLAAAQLTWVAQAPAPAQAVSSTQRVTADLRDADVRGALRRIFDAARVHYTFDMAVQGRVTVALADVPLRAAVYRILRATRAERPLTLRVMDGVYVVLPRVMETLVEPLGLTSRRTTKFAVDNLPAERVRMMLRTLGPWPDGDVTLVANPEDNSIIAVGSDEAMKVIRGQIGMLDVAPQQIQVKAEVVLVAEGASGKKQRLLLAESGRTLNGQPLTIKTSLTGPRGAAVVSQPGTGRYSLRVEPRLNGDNTIDLAATWTVDLSWQPSGSKPVHLTRTVEGALRARDGEAVSLSGLILKAGTGQVRSDAELLLFLTPRMVIEGPRVPGAPLQP